VTARNEVVLGRDQGWARPTTTSSISRCVGELGVRSVPVNFLIPIPGTPFESRSGLDPRRCLRVLCLYRFILPSQEIRIAGGREVHLRSLQPLGLYAANSIFIGDYLTTPGQTARADFEMIRDAGFVLEAPDGSALEGARLDEWLARDGVVA
jgi:biotin synthase